jgi:uroporphyrinogen decarboxylase
MYKDNKSNFKDIADILKGKKKPERVEILEFAIDEEIKKTIIEKYFDEHYVSHPRSKIDNSKFILDDFKTKKEDYRKYYQQTIKFWRKMGYSLLTDLTFISGFESLNILNNKTKDTAALPKDKRNWAIEGAGMIKDWKDFEKFPWDKADLLLEEYLKILDLIKDIMPDEMKVGVVGTLFEEPLEWILGYENFFFMLKDNPDLVTSVFDKMGKINYKFYKNVIKHEAVGCIFHADDLGFKTGTMISIQDLKKLVFPWLKKYAEVAHDSLKPFFLHSCGNKDQIMDILIDDVCIDAIHSFEDASYSVKKYKEIWGQRVGIIGGVDVDKLVRLDETQLRLYLKDILDSCMKHGRYVFGTGNSVTNYVPVKNYLIMLEEAFNWKKSSY